MKVGDTVTLTVKNPLWSSRQSYAYPIAEFKTYTGTVLPSPSWVGADQLCLSTGTVEFPFRILDRDRIIGLAEAREKPESRVFTIGGSKGRSYIVTLQKGLWGCNCVGFGYRRSCSHVVTAKAELAGVKVEPKHEEKKKKVEKKTCFNSKSTVVYKSKVKRAISPTHERKESMATQSGLALALYAKNKSISCDEFVTEFAKIFPSLPERTAALYWQNKARRAKFGLAPIALPAKYKNASSEPKVKTKKVPAAKMLTDLGLDKKGKFTGKIKAEVTKSADEIAKIKEANLERMKKVSAKLGKVRNYLPGQVAAPQDPTPADFDPQLAREEVAAMIAEIDRERSAMVARKTAHE